MAGGKGRREVCAGGRGERSRASGARGAEAIISGDDAIPLSLPEPGLTSEYSREQSRRVASSTASVRRLARGDAVLLRAKWMLRLEDLLLAQAGATRMPCAVGIFAIIFSVMVIVMPIMALRARLSVGVILATSKEVGAIWILAIRFAVLQQCPLRQVHSRAPSSCSSSVQTYVVVVLSVPAFAASLGVLGVRVERLTAVCGESVQVQLVEHDATPAFDREVMPRASHGAVEVAAGRRCSVAPASCQCL
jgi:hypothetical protein